jgi:hypothetical protein
VECNLLRQYTLCLSNITQNFSPSQRLRQFTYKQHFLNKP